MPGTAADQVEPGQPPAGRDRQCRRHLRDLGQQVRGEGRIHYRSGSQAGQFDGRQVGPLAAQHGHRRVGQPNTRRLPERVGGGRSGAGRERRQVTGVAAGQVVPGSQLRLVDVGVQERDLGEAERAEFDPVAGRRFRIGVLVGLRWAERHRGRHLARAVDEHEQQRRGHRIPQEVGDQAGGGGVRPVQVVEDQHQSVPGGQADQPAGRLVGPEPPGVRRRWHRARGLRPGRCGSPGTQSAAGWLALREGVPEHMEGNSSLVRRARPDGPRDRGGASFQGLADEAGLADARLSDHFADHLPAVAERGGLGFSDTRQLCSPPDEARARWRIFQPRCHHADQTLSGTP